MIARRIVLALLGLLLAAVPAMAQTSTDGWHLDPPEVAGGLAGGGNGGDAGGPWPGGSLGIRITPKNGTTKALGTAAALVLPRCVLLAWPAWDGHDTEIAVAMLDGSSRSNPVFVTRNAETDEAPVLLAGTGGRVVLSWVRRERGRATLVAVPLGADGSPVGKARAIGPAGRTRLVATLPGGRVAALVLRGAPGRTRVDLVVEGRPPVEVARLGRGGTLLDAGHGPGETLVFRLRDGSLAGRLTVGPGGIVEDLAWGED